MPKMKALDDEQRVSPVDVRVEEKLQSNERNESSVATDVGGDDAGDSPNMPPSATTLETTENEILSEPVEEEADDVTTWEFRNVSLTRAPGYGFGIAVSGGRDNPHFKNGDPSIVVSDVLRDGPACGLLSINDRIVNANGFSLDNADYATAVQIMKDSDHLNMIIKRRVRLPILEFEQRKLKFSLTKPKNKEDFGIVLGCKFYVKEITNKKLLEKEPGVRLNDVVTSINGKLCDDLTFAEARRMLEKSKERLSLIVERDVQRGTNWKWNSQATLYERLGSESRNSPTPRHSPMGVSRHSDDLDSRMSNSTISNGRFITRMQSAPSTASDYHPSPLRPSSYGSTLSRTTNQNAGDDYKISAVSHVLVSTTSSTPRTANGFANGDLYEVADKRNQQVFSCSLEPRMVSFVKENGSVGVRVVGGNEVGIFVSAVQPGSPAYAQGVRCGDQILMVNERDMRGVTREEAVLHMLSLSGRVDLIVQYKRDEYEYVKLNNLGDNFFIKTHFDYEKPENGELSFKNGDVFQITDTLFGGTVGAWQAISVVTTSENPPVKGVIPNSSRAERMLLTRSKRSSTKNYDDENRTGSLLRKKLSLARRSKSLTKNRLDEVVFAQEGPSRCPYERVILNRPDFLRPIVLFGPLADLAREKLLQDFPLRFASPQNEQAEDSQKKCGIIRLSSIKDIMNKHKHCVLDITPNSVEKLQYAQYCPIVVYMHVDSRARFKELRRKHLRSSPTISSRKVMDDAIKIQKSHPHLFTATLDASHEEEWFDGLLDLISRLQESAVWLGEKRPSNILDDELLFPSAYRYANYTNGCDSDVDINKTVQPNYSTLPHRYELRRLNKNDRTNLSQRIDNYGDSDDITKLMSSSMHSAFNLNTSMYDDYQQYGSMAQVSTDFQSSPLYENRETSAVSHFATLRRPPPNNLPRPKMKPVPPPRHIENHTLSMNTLISTKSNGLSTGYDASTTYDTDASTLTRDSTLTRNSQNVHDTSSTSLHRRIRSPRNANSNRFKSEPGFYNVSQILSDHQEEKYSTFSPQLAPHSLTPNGLTNSSQHGLENGSSVPRYRYPEVSLYATAPIPNGASRSSLSQPIAIINPSFQEMQNFPPSVDKSTIETRTSGIKTPTNNRANQSVNSNGGQFSRPVVETHATATTRNAQPPPPPPPAPRSPRSVFFANAAMHESFTYSEGENVENSEKNHFSLSNYAAEPLMNGQTALSNGNKPGAARKPSLRSPKPPVPEKPQNLVSNGPKNNPKNLDLLANREKHGGSAFELYNKNEIENSKMLKNFNDENNRAILDFVSGIIGVEGGTLKSESTGVVLAIPPRALTSKREVFFKVFRDADMEPPLDKIKGETLLSPLLLCGPQGLKFEKPVELILPHNADNENWSLALKSANAEGVGNSRWRQVPLADANGKFVSIFIEQF